MAFYPQLPADLATLPVILTTKTEGAKVLTVGLQVYPGLPESFSETFDVNGLEKAGHAAIENQVLPRIREIFAEEISAALPAPVVAKKTGKKD